MTAVAARVRHFTRIADLRPVELERLLELAADPQGRAGSLRSGAARANGRLHLREAVDAHPSLLCRGGGRLGATPVALSPQELQIGRGESIADTARSLSGYCAAIVIRTFAQETVDELAAWATVPVVNALSDEHHPVPGAGRRAHDPARPVRRPARPAARLRRRRRRQRRPLAARGGRARRASTSRSPVRPSYRPKPAILENARHLAESTGADADGRPRPARSRGRRGRRLRRRLGLDGRGGRARDARPDARAVRGHRGADGAWRSPTRSSSTACRPSAARRSSRA